MVVGSVPVHLVDGMLHCRPARNPFGQAQLASHIRLPPRGDEAALDHMDAVGAFALDNHRWRGRQTARVWLYGWTRSGLAWQCGQVMMIADALGLPVWKLLPREWLPRLDSNQQPFG